MILLPEKRSIALSENSEVIFGEVPFPQRSTMKQPVLYQGTASAVP
jgi:hypothetical protein